VKYVNCEICNSDNFKLLFITKDYDWGLPGEFSIVRCNKCGLIFINPRPDYEELKRYYPEGYHSVVCENELTQEQRKNLNLIYNKRYKFLKKFKSAGRLLDVGCGDGLFLNFIKNKGWEVCGVEPSKLASDFAKNKLNLKIYNSDLINAHLEESDFDVITMWEVLEHIPNLNENLKEVCRLLKEDGIFIASVPNFRSIQRVLFGKYWYAIKAPTHLYHFTSNTLRKLLFNNGFLNVKVYNSLINIKNPVRGYSDSLRYFLSEYNLYPSRVSLLKKVDEVEHKERIKNLKYFIISMLHFMEFIIFSILELLSFFIGRTGTIFVVAKKK
jgi:2-polyprenyl-3-methyl-5-hydroxy-6-metoxy-1,4-benzoquinol methylase